MVMGALIMYRPVGWNNYYIDSEKTDGMMRAEAFEEGADAMLLHVISLAKKSAPGSKLLEVLSRA